MRSDLRTPRQFSDYAGSSWPDSVARSGLTEVFKNLRTLTEFLEVVYTSTYLVLYTPEEYQGQASFFCFFFARNLDHLNPKIQKQKRNVWRKKKKKHLSTAG